MKENELRLGNHIQDGKGNFYMVSGLPMFGGVQITSEDTVYPIDIFKPIPITEEWLMHFRFEKENDFKHPNGPIYFANVRGELICFLHNCSHRHIKHVHQLQNLLYILTGEELTLKTE